MGEYRTPQSTRCGAKVAGLGGRDWGVSEAAHITPLLAMDEMYLHIGEYCTCYLLYGVCVCVSQW